MSVVTSLRYWRCLHGGELDHHCSGLVRVTLVRGTPSLVRSFLADSDLGAGGCQPRGGEGGGGLRRSCRGAVPAGGPRHLVGVRLEVRARVRVGAAVRVGVGVGVGVEVRVGVRVRVRVPVAAYSSSSERRCTTSPMVAEWSTWSGLGLGLRLGLG